MTANAQNGDWYQNPKKKNIAYRPRLFFTNGAKNVVLHGVQVCNSYSWTIHPTYSENVDILNIRIRNSSQQPQHRRHRPRELQECQYHRQPYPCGRRLHCAEIQQAVP